MIMISVESVHEIIVVHGELREDFIGYLMNSDGDSSHAGLFHANEFFARAYFGMLCIPSESKPGIGIQIQDSSFYYR
jgi:hypothetical protein